MGSEVEHKHCKNCKEKTPHYKKHLPEGFIWTCLFCGNENRDGGGNEPAQLVGPSGRGGGYAS